MNKTNVFLTRCVQTISAIGLACSVLQLNAMDCPVTPTKYKDVDIPNPDPAPANGEFPADMDLIYDYVINNNIKSVKELLDHMPLHMRKHYSFIKNTGALNETDLNNPGLLPWGSDTRFMMNIGSKKDAPLYEVVDMAYLQDDGDWEFRALDFRGATPLLSPDGGTNGECRQCHAKGGDNNVAGPMRPILGNYLFWTGFFSDSNGASGEDVTAEEVPVLRAIKEGNHNNDRFHTLLFASRFADQEGTSINLPDHAYGPGLTIFNTELSSAVAESVHKRLSRNTNYRGLREEMLAISYCDSKGRLSSQQREKLVDLVSGVGGTKPSGYATFEWERVYRALGLEPRHEFPVHFKTEDDLATVPRDDINWNTGVSSIREVVDMLILMELAEENTELDNILKNNQSSYDMTSGCSFNSLKDHLAHKIYALFTLKGNARQKARESYYDIDYVRIHSSLNNVTGQMCNLLTNDISLDTIGDPGNNTNQPPVAEANGPYNATTADDINFSSAGSSDPDGSINSYNWDFGDGNSSSDANPIHRYTSAGSFTATLTVTDDNGAIKRDTASVTITGTSNGGNELENGVAKTGLSGSTNDESRYYIDVPNGASNLVIQITGGSGDADLYVKRGSEPQKSDGANNQCRPYKNGNEEECTEANPSSGRWHVMLVAYNSYSNVSLTASYDSSSNQVPVAKVNGPYTGSVNKAVRFSSNGSSDPDGSISSYSWNFGDGNTSASANPTHTYRSEGTYNVTLKVTDNSGASSSEAKTTATISASSTNKVPVAEANGPYSGTVGTKIAFSKAGSNDPDGTIASYAWDFGDGSSSSTENPTHAYNAEGTYTVKLTVTDNNGETASDTATVTVAKANTDIKLGNGQSITGLSGATGDELHYFMHIHGDAPKNLKISISGGSGDADLYVRYNEKPKQEDGTTNQCRPYKNGNVEDCTYNSPQHGAYHIMIRGYSAFSGVTLTGSYDEGNDTGGEHTVMIHNSSQHGNYLAGGATSTSQGMSLYTWDNDPSSGSNCNGSCAQSWPPLTVSSASDVSAPNGISLGTTTRDNGSLQVTFEGKPLYFYASDSSTGDTTGDGVGGTWHLAKLSTTPPSNNEYGLKNACGLGRPAISNQNLELGKAYCAVNASSNAQEVHFKYVPTSADAGKDILFTIGHGTGIAGLTGNQAFGDYASEDDFKSNPSKVYGSFGLDPLNKRRTYNRVIVKNVQANKDIWLSMIAGSGGFNGVTIKGEAIVPVDSNLPDACAEGKPEITDEYVNLGEAVCGKRSPGSGHYTHFTYRPTAAEEGKNFILETNHGTGNANMTANQHYSDAPTSGGTGFAHEEHLADRPDLVFSSFREGVQQRIVYPNAEAGKDILVVIPPGPNGFSKFTFRIRVVD
ncbi:PKD domain-containing protein [Aliikangiella sp. IMCC44359]|uniref:PKD domain-containing protein n=1 Tax=Aliikangiella sp. IMCC44359 TaxID=3459125 RepID=UPI00403A9F33